MEVSRLLKALEYGYRRYRMIREWRRLVEKLKSVAREVLGPDTRVCVFGSVVRGRYTAASDVDVLIVSPRVPSDWRSRAELKIALEEALGIGPLDPNPLEIHLVRSGEESWYLEHLGIECVDV